MRRLSPSTIIASLALFFSLAGTGLAAHHYLITSSRQISPHVRKQLRGPRGFRGARGPKGATGVAGAASAIDWGKSYYVVKNAALPTSSPEQSVVVSCHPGDHAVTGGFDGTGEIVTSDNPTRSQAVNAAGFNGWRLAAHRDPNFTPKSGIGGPVDASVSAWAICMS